MLPWCLPFLKLTAKAPENGWLEYYFPIGARPIFRVELLVSGRVPFFFYICLQNLGNILLPKGSNLNPLAILGGFPDQFSIGPALVRS